MHFFDHLVSNKNNSYSYLNRFEFCIENLKYYINLGYIPSQLCITVKTPQLNINDN